MKESLGLDLAGYSTKGSAIAMARRTDELLTATILDGYPLQDLTGVALNQGNVVYLPN